MTNIDWSCTLCVSYRQWARKRLDPSRFMLSRFAVIQSAGEHLFFLLFYLFIDCKGISSNGIIVETPSHGIKWSCYYQMPVSCLPPEKRTNSSPLNKLAVVTFIEVVFLLLWTVSRTLNCACRHYSIDLTVCWRERRSDLSIPTVDPNARCGENS